MWHAFPLTENCPRLDLTATVPITGICSIKPHSHCAPYCILCRHTALIDYMEFNGGTWIEMPASCLSMRLCVLLACWLLLIIIATADISLSETCRPIYRIHRYCCATSIPSPISHIGLTLQFLLLVVECRCQFCYTLYSDVCMLMSVGVTCCVYISTSVYCYLLLRLGHWMVVCKCHRRRDCRMLFTAVCGVGRIWITIMSCRQWTTVNMHLA